MEYYISSEYEEVSEEFNKALGYVLREGKFLEKACSENETNFSYVLDVCKATISQTRNMLSLKLVSDDNEGLTKLVKEFGLPLESNQQNQS